MHLLSVTLYIIGRFVVGKSRQMFEESNLTWDLCCEVDTRRESTWKRDSAIYPGFSTSLSRGKSIFLLLIITGSDSSIRRVGGSITSESDRNLSLEEI